MGYEGTVKILSYLSKMLNGNIDLIEFIYQKKKIIFTIILVSTVIKHQH